MKRTGIVMAIGGVLGFSFVTLYGADAISWWNRPLGGANVLSCDGSIREAITLFIKAQFAVAGGLAVLFAGGDGYIRYKRSRKAALANSDAGLVAPAASPAPSPGSKG